MTFVRTPGDTVFEVFQNHQGGPGIPGIGVQLERNTQRAYKKAWARLLSMVYEFDPFICPICGSEMKVLAIILKPQEIKRILHHLVKQGRPPPGIDLDALN